MDAIPVGQLSAMQTLNNIITIVNTLSVRFLDASAHRGIVFGDRKAYQRTVMELDRTLYQTLAERTAAYDGGTVPILDCTRYNLAGRCRILINEHHQFTVTETARYPLLG